MTFFEQLWQDLLALTVIAAVILTLYSQIAKKSISELLTELRDMLNPKEEEK